MARSSIPSRVAIIAMKEDDFGVDANLLFSHHGPRIPRGLLTRDGGAPNTITRAKVAEFFMENVNDCIRNLRFNQNLDDPCAIGYVNFAKKKSRSSMIDFEEVHEELTRWSESCCKPFTAVIWVDANWKAYSNKPRRLIPTRPLILQEMSKPFFRPLDVGSSSDNEKVNNSDGMPAVRLSRVFPGGGGGALNVKANKENKNARNRLGFSEAIMRKNKLPAPGSIYAERARVNTPAANAYGMGPLHADAAIRPKSRCARLTSRAQGGFLEQAIRQSITPGPSYDGGSSFQVQKTSRLRREMNPQIRSSTRCSSHGTSHGPMARKALVARRPSTVGNSSPRAIQGRARRFQKSKQDQGICYQPYVTKSNMFVLQKVDAPGPRYYVGGGMGAGLSGGAGGKHAKCKYRGAFSRSPRF